MCSGRCSVWTRSASARSASVNSLPDSDEDGAILRIVRSWRDFSMLRECLFAGLMGLTPARVRTAWHGSADVSPVGHAANLMLDMNVWNFGVQEASVYLNTSETLKEVFPGTPELRNGYMWPNGKPGIGGRHR